ncbi:hypothetical protein ACTJJ7_19955 [Phyllobacterium sp. 22229]|uniref:hypothetical protein n=1 Tax=Phyllobacterium sp. 22229 TaxID=3453895 RepID=UPI003F874376
MAFSVGDIVLFESSVAGKAKFHFCFYFDDNSERFGFIFLNSEGEYRDHFGIDCGKIPELPKSRTGRTVFSCPTVMRKTPKMLGPLRPRKMCRLPKDVASEFYEFAKSITSMIDADKSRLLTTLKLLMDEA